MNGKKLNIDVLFNPVTGLCLVVTPYYQSLTTIKIPANPFWDKFATVKYSSTKNLSIIVSCGGNIRVAGSKKENLKHVVDDNKKYTFNNNSLSKDMYIMAIAETFKNLKHEL